MPLLFYFLVTLPPPVSPLFPYTTLFRSRLRCIFCGYCVDACPDDAIYMTRDYEMAIDTRARSVVGLRDLVDRKSTRLNSSHITISYAVFCLKKKKIKIFNTPPSPYTTI